MRFIEYIKLFITERITRPVLNYRHIPFVRTSVGVFKTSSMSKDRKKAEIVFSKAVIEIQVRQDGIISLNITFSGDSSDYFTYSICETGYLPVILQETENTIEVHNKAHGTRIDILKDSGAVVFLIDNTRTCFLHDIQSSKNGWIFTEVRINESVYFTGFGQKTGTLFKQKEKLVMWNTDESKMDSSSDPLYQSCPFAMATGSHASAGFFFDNPHYSVFETDSAQDKSLLKYRAAGGPLQIYLCKGPDPYDVLYQFTSLTGRFRLPPLWALGHHHSRWESKESAERIIGIAAEFRRRKIPCDVMHMDIGYMNEYRSFTWDKNKFPDPAGLMSLLHENSFKAVVMTDPGLKKDAHWKIYKEGIKKGFFCKKKNGSVAVGTVWPGDAVFPDFANPAVQKWWGLLFKVHSDIGVDGYWIDMNEPSVFSARRTLPDTVLHTEGEAGIIRQHKTIHNIYGLLMARATAEGLEKLDPGKRIFLFSRSAYAGIQKYASTWTGDIRSNWEHLAMAIPMMLNMGLSGQVMTGPDLGGFWGAPTPELMMRWMAAAVFFPFHRNHTMDGSPPQELWYFGMQAEEICRAFIVLRYWFIPYIYFLFFEAFKTGKPVLRPLFLEFPKDENCFTSAVADSQYMAGKNVLAAPVLQEGITSRQVYLPGKDTTQWVNFFTHGVEPGGRTITVPAPPDALPLFIKRGAAFAVAEDILVTEEWYKSPLCIIIYPGSDISGYVYFDDGQTKKYQNEEFILFEIKGFETKKELKIKIDCIEGTLNPESLFRTMEIRIAQYAGQKKSINKIISNKKKIQPKNISVTQKWICISQIMVEKNIFMDLFY